MRLHFSILFFLLVVIVNPVFASESDQRSPDSVLSSDTKEDHLLTVRKSFPQYARQFNEQAVQEEVYTEVLKELKEKELFNDKKEGEEQ